MKIITPDREQLARFHAGIYLDAFAAHREPLESWLSPRGYAFHARLVLDGDDIVGGITYELYPKSRCGLVTYMVVAPRARGRGLGRMLFMSAARELYAAGAKLVLGEVHRSAPERLARFDRWGARVVDVAYVQPSLGPGLERDDGLCLIVLPPVPRVVEEGVVKAFIAELYEVTEGAP
ncbi:MAG TPA: GNAT family N-acetyltransferase [Kofleriaceae bacterium]|nr:GNAT family N-acetyltransferase [Kofleriaceae bacterium]